MGLLREGNLNRMCKESEARCQFGAGGFNRQQAGHVYGNNRRNELIILTEEDESGMRDSGGRQHAKRVRKW